MTITDIEGNEDIKLITADEGKLITLASGGLKVTEATVGTEFVEDWIEVDPDPVS